MVTEWASLTTVIVNAERRNMCGTSKEWQEGRAQRSQRAQKKHVIHPKPEKHREVTCAHTTQS